VDTNLSQISVQQITVLVKKSINVIRYWTCIVHETELLTHKHTKAHIDTHTSRQTHVHSCHYVSVVITEMIQQQGRYMVKNGLSAGGRLGRVLTSEMLMRVEMSIKTG